MNQPPKPVRKKGLTNHPSTAFPFTVVRYTMHRANCVWNVHDYFEFAVVESGHGEYKTLKEKRSFRKGQVIATNQGESHLLHPTGNAVLHYIQFRRDFLPGLPDLLSPNPWNAALLLSAYLRNESGGVSVLTPPPADAIHLLHLTQSMARELSSKPEGFQVMIRALFTEFLVCLHRAAAEGERLEQRKSARSFAASIESVMAHVQSHYAEDLSLEMLSQLTPFSAEYFSRIFKKHTSYHLHEYINEVRIREACRFLKDATCPISEVGYRVGFPSTPYFNRVFRKLMGTTPSAFQHRAPAGS